MRWRLMQESDLDRVAALADAIHPSYPEDCAVFANRFHLYPAGCLILNDDGRVAGYAIAHPWTKHRPLQLNNVLDRLPSQPDTYYIHDIGLQPAARGRAHAQNAVLAIGFHALHAGLNSLSLIAIASAKSFWLRQGFYCCAAPDAAGLLKSYGQGAEYMVKDLISP